MASTPYRPLNSREGAIRILKILPSKNESEEIRCELVDHSLGDRLEYEALSYTWGTPGPEPRKYIRLDAHHFQVHENLSAALHRLREYWKPRLIWIDAICINQEDVREREQQILLMRQIYGQAQRVVVWLGEAGLGEDLAVQSILRTAFSLVLSTKTWKIERKFGLIKGLKNRMSRGMGGEWIPNALIKGEVAQLLDRKWWRRVWIIQEVVVAQKVVIMWGRSHVPWETLERRMREGIYSLRGPEDRYVSRTKEGSVVARFQFPDTNYVSLRTLRDKWQAQQWDQSLYNLLYTFRRYECTKHSDRVYAFIGLAKDAKDIDIQPDYSSPTATVFTSVARSLIIVHKHLLLFNLKRASSLDRSATYQGSQVYSVVDQARFVDPNGTVVRGKHEKPHEGWVRLPHGWERRRDGWRFRFYNHLTGQYQDTSPLAGEPPELAQPMSHWLNLPPGWNKTWDNLGNTQFVFSSDNKKLEPSEEPHLESLPTWVPDWTAWSTKDPEPFPSLVHEDEPRYWASGQARKVHFASNYDSNSQELRLSGVLFDKIKDMTSPWCPEPHLLPVDRIDNHTLQDWEAFATRPVPDCPYAEFGGRYDAYWRTHIADYAGQRRATDQQSKYFETWANREEWVSRVRSRWGARRVGKEIVTEERVMGSMSAFMLKKGFVKMAINPFAFLREVDANYKDMRQRIHSASIGRAMFVTSKGFIGLAPWNAQQGDVISVLLGGCTPFILRQTPRTEQYSLVGEVYVYGIMGGELFSGEMGHPRMRAFDIV